MIFGFGNDRHVTFCKTARDVTLLSSQYVHPNIARLDKEMSTLYCHTVGILPFAVFRLRINSSST